MLVIKNADGTYVKNAKEDTTHVTQANKFCSVFVLKYTTIIPVPEGGDNNVDKK